VETEVRQATEQEATALFVADPPQGAERWVGVCVRDGQIVGQIALTLSYGEVFGHDTKVFIKDDAHIAARLWLAARRKCREWGIETVNVHFGKDDGHMLNFWASRGFEPAFVVYRGRI
jgi:GNAT superfamily N-acetyltransferase